MTFTTEDHTNTAVHYRQRMEEAAAQAADAGLDGLLVTPGPDLVHLTGYRPAAITERLTMLVLGSYHDPHLIVPALERPDAARADGSAAVTLINWWDGDDPYAVVASMIDPRGRYALSGSAWAMHMIRLQVAVPGSRYTALTGLLPVRRAVKDADEVWRLTAAEPGVPCQEITGWRGT